MSIRAECAANLGTAVYCPILAVNTATKIRIESDPGDVSGLSDAARRPGLKLSKPADLPTSHHFAGQPGCVAEYRQIIDIVDRENVTNIEFGSSPHRACVIRIRDDIALSICARDKGALRKEYTASSGANAGGRKHGFVIGTPRNEFDAAHNPHPGDYADDANGGGDGERREKTSGVFEDESG